MSRLILSVLLVVSTSQVLAQQATPSLATGHAALGLALRRLATTGTLMMATAHPDDENNAVLALASRGLGIRTTLATATRGDGGQNEIGPELFDALAALRTEELLAAHRFDGAEQFFTRAVDFGYSFSVEETLERWGHDEILGDYVRLIRMIRPDVIVALRPEGAGGGQHHQASARLAREAFRAAGDPSKFPRQLREGLHAWQARKFYFTASFGFRGEPPPDPGKKLVTMDLERYDPLLGRTYAEIGSEARAMHKCQGFGQLLALPAGNVFARYELIDTTIESQRTTLERSLFDGLDLSIAGLAAYAGSPPPLGLGSELQAIAGHVGKAETAFNSGSDAGTIAPLAAGLASTRALRARLKTAGLSEAIWYEIDFRLAQKERQFQDALVLAQGLRLEFLARDGVVVGGQELQLTAIVANRGGAPVELKSVQWIGFDAPPACSLTSPTLEVGVSTCDVRGRVPAGAKPTGAHWRRRADADRYDFDPDVPFGAPFAPTPFRAAVTLEIAGVDVTIDRPVEYRYEGDIFSGEKRMELKVVPAFAVRIAPEVAIVTPESRTREIRVTVTNSARGPASEVIGLQTPAGWRVEPKRAPIAFTREDEAQAVRFRVTPPAGVRSGEYRVHATVGAEGDAPAGLGYQVVEYPHIRRRHLLGPATIDVKALEVRVAPNLQIGYIMGAGDQVPQAIEQLGAAVEFIDADELAWGDLSRFDAIMTGVRAYERRADLRAHNHRLLEYASRGGVVIVQYNKFEFNDAQYGPYPAKVGSNRITDERAAVTVLAPDHPVFRAPNRIDDDSWAGWVQERGLYFLGDRDPRYVDLVELTDPFDYNRGPKRGALVEAQTGSGRWIYVGLALWRQLAAGTPGAYGLLANLLSLKPSGRTRV